MSPLLWDDLRIFLAAARHGRLVAAARVTGLNHATISRRLTALETAIGARLLDRSPRGVTLTVAGTVLLDHAERMERELETAAATLDQRDTQVTGDVRISTPETFGTVIVAPAVAQFHAAYPALTLELLPESRSVSLANREADLAVMLNPPPRGRLIARRLVDYRLGLYASRDYLAAHGPIDTLDALLGHKFCGYIDAMVDLPELHYLDEVREGITPVFRSTSSAAQQIAVASGMGLAMLHHFAVRDDPRLVPVLPGQVEAVRSYWLVVHADRQRLPRVRAGIEFLDSLIAQHRERF